MGFRQMDHFASSAARADRRESPRHYLARPMRAEVVYGRQRIAIESGAICDVSRQGLGLRASHSMKLVPGAAVTIAVSQDDKVTTLYGQVATVRHGIELGIKVGGAGHNPLLDMLGRGVDSAVVSAPRNGKASLSGTVTITARHPIRWAVDAGATCLDMSDVTTLDSSGLGLLLHVNERHAITIEKCTPQVCRLIKLCQTQRLCAADCPKA